MCKISLNQDLNGIEISFEKKPEQATLNAIKEQGFRWHRAKKVWYAKQTKDRLTFAESLGEIGTTTTTQAELIERYMDIICNEVWTSDNMRNYARKNIGYIVELENGDIMDIEKPRPLDHHRNRERVCRNRPRVRSGSGNPCPRGQSVR